MKDRLYLCGTNHLDLSGPERLTKVLETLNPDCIAIESYPELSREVLEKRKEAEGMDEQTLLKRFRDLSKLPLEEIKTDSALAIAKCVGYELWVPFEYAQKTGARIVEIEDEERATRITNKFLEDMFNDSPETNPLNGMLKLSPKMLGKILDFCYELDSEENVCEVTERNRIFADRIAPLKGRVLVVTGAGHIYGKEPTLPTLLKKYDPVDFKLIQADYFGPKEHKKYSVPQEILN
jgi:pheromone shutdown protein TraB